LAERLSALDVSFLYLERDTSPIHLGNLAIFDGPAQLSYERLVELVERRISLVSLVPLVRRYRQRVVWVPGRLANPVWVDDPDFDVGYHVRRSGLPSPGTDEQLREFCARIQSRPLDRRRPLWEMYLVEGLVGGRVAIVSKTHYAMVDAARAVDLEQVLFDDEAQPGGPEEIPDRSGWAPPSVPPASALVADAVADLIRRPAAAFDVARLAVTDVRSTLRRVMATATGMASAAAFVVSPPRSSPLQARAGERRRFAGVRVELAGLRQVHLDQDVTVNDVVLAVVAGALRGWLLFRGEAVAQTAAVRTLVPMSVHDPARIVPTFVDLPVGESNPIVRLSQIAFATRANSALGVGAAALTALNGFAPPTLHAIAARVGGGLSNRLFALAVTNVPGPQRPLYLSAARSGPRGRHLVL
jgi:diacylglycerol O-acyltransferase